MPIGKARIHREGDDVTVITWGAMVYTADEAAEAARGRRRLGRDRRPAHGDRRGTRRPCSRASRKTSKVLVLHEDTRTGGFGAEIAATIAEEAFEDLDAPVKRIAAPDAPVPFSPPLEKAYIPQVEDVVAGTEGAGRVLMATTEAVDVVMPQMGVSVSEGTITKWLKQEGEAIEADEPLLEISTDKVDTEVPSPASGVVKQILVQEGETVEVGTKLAVIGAEAGARRTRLRPPSPSPRRPRSRPRRRAVEQPPTPEPARLPAPAPAEAAASNGKSFVSPVVARIASEHGVDVSSVPGTGRGGRVTKKDILAFVESGPPAAPPPAKRRRPLPEPAPAARRRSPLPPPRQPAPAAPAPAAAAPPDSLRRRPAPEPAAATAGEQLEPMNAMRRGIAEHMRRSLDTSAHVTSAIEVDMSRVVEIREKLKPEYQKTYGVNPTYLIFVARAAVETLKRVPVDQRRDSRRADRHAELRQPRLRGRARRRQGSDRPGRQARRGPEPARDGAGA